jgi:hypothetical protein
VGKWYINAQCDLNKDTKLQSNLNKDTNLQYNWN